LADDRKNSEEPPLHYEAGIPVLPGPVEREDAARNREKSEEREYKQEHKSIQRGILRTQIALVIFGVLGTGVSLWQANIAQQSADNSQRSVLLAQRSERDGRLMNEKQLIESRAQFDKTLKQMQKQTSGQQDAANAATSAANTAKETLHVSERAYVIVEEPRFDFPTKSALIPLVNTGHLPSGKAVTTVHEATYNTHNITGAFSFDNPAEKSWQHTQWDTVVPGSHQTLAVPVPLLEESQMNKGSQSVIVAGTIVYNDGFTGTKDQTWQFCFRNVYQVVMKKSYIIVCDPEEILPKLEKADGYPNNENPH
jgi:hypothetical protein